MKPPPPGELPDVDPHAPVLRDIHTLLEVLGTEGIEAGTSNVPAMKALASINARLAEPIRLDVQRGQFRSYPNIQALYLLLRTTGLTRVEQSGAKKRLVLDASNADAFRSLNPTEQFGSLLDAWLFKARVEAIGIRERSYDGLFSAMVDCWAMIKGTGLKSTAQERAGDRAPFARDLDRVSLWLMREFGMIDLDQGSPIPGKPWNPQSVRRTPFGGALLAVLARSKSLPYEQWRIIRQFWPTFRQAGEPPELDPVRSRDKAAAPPALGGAISFDTLHSAFQPHWPAWQRSHNLPALDFREGVFVLKVCLNEIWRVIAIPARKTVESLSDAILKSVKFDDEHLWNFEMDDRLGGSITIAHPYGDAASESHRANDVLIGDLPLSPGESMTYTYDYGDNWQFDVELLRVNAPDPKLKAPRVIESHGKAPKQYTGWDD